MKLSIIIINYNTAKITLNCLKSIEKYPLNNYKFEVILVDNGSTDDSAKLLKNFKSNKFKYKFIKNKLNLGFSKGNNIGLEKSKGEYKLLLNSDTLLTKNALNILVKTAEESSEDVGLIAARLINKDKSIQPSVFREPTVLRTIRQYWLGEKLLDKYYPNNKTEVEIVVFAAVLIKPIAIKKVGLMNEEYFMYFEDFDYCRAVRNAGLKIIYEPKAQIYHLHGASGKNISDDSNQWRRMIPSSKIYHGKLRYYLIFIITWIGQKLDL